MNLERDGAGGGGESAGLARHARIYSYRRYLVLALYGAIAGLSYLACFLLRFEFAIPPDYRRILVATLPVVVLARVLFAVLFRLTTGRWRFAGALDAIRLAQASVAGTTLIVLFTDHVPGFGPPPVSVMMMDMGLVVLLTAGVWLGYRTGVERISHRRSRRRRAAKRALVIGAGEAGYALVHEMLRAPAGYRPVGFVDDDPFKWGTRIHGVEVIGGTVDLVPIAAAERADEIVIAVPSAAPPQLRRIVESCERTGLPFRVLPGIREVLAGGAQLAQLRKVRVEDLLGREPVELELPEIAADLAGRTVLITGAAGSIGSELARQVAANRPAALIVFDHAETALYYLELEIRESYPDVTLVPVVGDIVDACAVDRVFERFAPERVFHAAAYKHVPMMELNAREAVRNNVIGTWRVADAAGRHGAEKFVLVSTDKAVRPVSVMGASKRTAELVVLELQERHEDTAYAAVRFGNVLGSNGSVIPIFRRQMEDGKPLTVTHPEATRYFMTIPEAVQLVLQASLLPQLRGNIAMLDMGDPVRILDLARNLLRLCGQASEPDRDLVFTGLRPGERLHEELTGPEELTAPTEIPKVHLVETHFGERRLLDSIVDWSWALDMGEERTVLADFRSLYPDLQPSLDHEPADERPTVVFSGIRPAARAASEGHLRAVSK